jgi:hypothetical protein
MTTSSYTCPFCRLQSDGSGTTCPHCGAPTEVRIRVTDSGWAEQPPIRDMARIRFNRSTCQITGRYVPVAEMQLDQSDSVYFSHYPLGRTMDRFFTRGGPGLLLHAPGNARRRDQQLRRHHEALVSMARRRVGRADEGGMIPVAGCGG